MKRLQVITLFLILTKFIFATGQHSDYVVFNGDTLVTCSDIFKQYPNYNVLIEKIYTELEKEDMKVNPQNYVSNERISLDYHSTWIIKNNKLILTEIKSGSTKIVYGNLSNIFGDKVTEGIIFADWLTDTINLCKGKVLVYGVHDIWDNEIELSIKKGILTKSKTYKNHVVKMSNFIVSEEFIYKNIDWEKLPDLGKNSIQTYIGIKPRKDGKFNGFDEGSLAIINSEVITDKENPFLKEAFRIAKLVPEWSVVVQRNKIVTLSMTIYFDERLKQKYAR